MDLTWIRVKKETGEEMGKRNNGVEDSDAEDGFLLHVN